MKESVRSAGFSIFVLSLFIFPACSPRHVSLYVDEYIHDFYLSDDVRSLKIDAFFGNCRLDYIRVKMPVSPDNIATLVDRDTNDYILMTPLLGMDIAFVAARHSEKTFLVLDSYSQYASPNLSPFSLDRSGIFASLGQLLSEYTAVHGTENVFGFFAADTEEGIDEMNSLTRNFSPPDSVQTAVYPIGDTTNYAGISPFIENMKIIGPDILLVFAGRLNSRIFDEVRELDKTAIISENFLPVAKSNKSFPLRERLLYSIETDYSKMTGLALKFLSGKEIPASKSYYSLKKW